MNTVTTINNNEKRTLWHVMIDLAYEGTHDDNGQEGVEKVRKVLHPLVDNGSGIKQIIFLRLPETDRMLV